MAIAELAAEIAEGFDELRAEFLGSAAKLLLLRTDGSAVAYSLLETITQGWYPYFSEYFGMTTFQVASIETVFADKVRRASHLAVIDSTNQGLNNALYKLDASTQPPLGDEPFWKLRATSTGDRY